jgi:hypothetical protein
VIEVSSANAKTEKIRVVLMPIKPEGQSRVSALYRRFPPNLVEIGQVGHEVSLEMPNLGEILPLFCDNPPGPARPIGDDVVERFACRASRWATGVLELEPFWTTTID